MSFVSSAAYAAAQIAPRPGIAVVTGGRSGLGLALVKKIASFAFIEEVFAVSRSISQKDVEGLPKVIPLAADVGTVEGRNTVVSAVRKSCDVRNRQLRFLVHSAGTIDPIKGVLQVTPEEFRNAMTINCEAPFFLTTALYPYLRDETKTTPGRVLHVSSGAAHGAPPNGWSVYGITKAAFYQQFKALEREFREAGGEVVVGSFKPGVVDTNMQATIRQSSEADMPVVKNFVDMKERVASVDTSKARPPPKGALDSPDNVAHFVEFLLLGTTDEEFANKTDSNEWDIRNANVFHRWIPPENLPESG